MMRDTADCTRYPWNIARNAFEPDVQEAYLPVSYRRVRRTPQKARHPRFQQLHRQDKRKGSAAPQLAQLPRIRPIAYVR